MAFNKLLLLLLLLLHPGLPTDEATKSISADIPLPQIHYTVRLAAHACHQFVIRQLSFLTRTKQLDVIKEKLKGIQQNSFCKRNKLLKALYH